MDDEDVEVGEVVPQREIEARVDDGRYEVVLDPDEIPSGFWDGEDYVNFDLRVVDGGRMAFWGTTAHLVDGDFWHSDSGVRVGDRVLRIDFDLGRETVRETGATSRSGLAVMDLGEASAGLH